MRERVEVGGPRRRDGRSSRSGCGALRGWQACSVALLSGLFPACGHMQTAPASPDELVLTPAVAQPEPEPFAIFSGGAAGRLLTRHLRTMVDFSEGAARQHRVSVAGLRSAPEEIQQQMLSELVAAYARQPEAAYQYRWLILSALADLERAEALDTMSEIALSELPPERLSQLDPHASSQGEELVIRLAAVRGVVGIASAGNAAADERLLELVAASPHRAVRIQAIQGYLYAPLYLLDSVPLDRYRQSDEYRRRLTVVRESLPAEDQGLLELRPLTSELAPTPAEVIDSIRLPVVDRGPFPLPGLRLPPEPNPTGEDHD